MTGEEPSCAPEVPGGAGGGEEPVSGGAKRELPAITRVLVVDDEPGFTRLLKLTLERAGHYEVLEENDGAAAVAAARRFRPHVILLDIVMPGLDGGDVAARLKADAEVGGTPVIFLTAIVSGREAGARELIGGYPFLPKPVDLARLRGAIASLVGGV
jgi:CheY-like chemotaxis protein